MNIFETKNKQKKQVLESEFFPLLKENSAEISEKLQEVGVQKIELFDKFEKDFENLLCNKLTLLIMPIFNECDEEGVKTTEELKKDGFTDTEKLVPVDIEGGQKRGYTKYYKDKNLVVASINPFYEQKLLDNILNSLRLQKLETLDKESIMTERLVNMWIETSKSRVESLKRDLSNQEDRAKESLDKYTRAGKQMISLRKSIEEASKTSDENREELVKQLELARKMPMVKSFEINKDIEISFGDIYINDKIRKGNHTVDGIVMPKYDLTRVYIGNLKFRISQDNLMVKNTTCPVDDHAHPHASSGEWGNMCTGEVNARMRELLNKLDLVGLTKLLYSWAISYNRGDAYHKIQHFYDQNGSEKK